MAVTWTTQGAAVVLITLTSSSLPRLHHACFPEQHPVLSELSAGLRGENSHFGAPLFQASPALHFAATGRPFYTRPVLALMHHMVPVALK
jgi:hypothetical protein